MTRALAAVLALAALGACKGPDRNPVVPDPHAPIVEPTVQPSATPAPTVTPEPQATRTPTRTPAPTAEPTRPPTTNLPPHRVFPPTLPPQPSRTTVVLLGNVEDPESGPLCGRQYCLDARASGACGPSVFFECTCLGGAMAEVRTGDGPGTCTVEVRVRDDVGAVATLTTRFEVRAP